MDSSPVYIKHSCCEIIARRAIKIPLRWALGVMMPCLTYFIRFGKAWNLKNFTAQPSPENSWDWRLLDELEKMREAQSRTIAITTELDTEASCWASHDWNCLQDAKKHRECWMSWAIQR